MKQKGIDSYFWIEYGLDNSKWNYSNWEKQPLLKTDNPEIVAMAPNGYWFLEEMFASSNKPSSIISIINKPTSKAEYAIICQI